MHDYDLVPLAFDDAGRPIPVQEPAVYDDPGDQGGESSGRLDLQQFLVCVLAGARNSTDVGERVVVAAYLVMTAGSPGSLEELGAFFGTSKSTAGRKVDRHKRHFRGELAKLRQKAGQPGP